jgi:hypothetical protein
MFQTRKPSMVYAGRMDHRSEHFADTITWGVMSIGAQPYLQCAERSLAADSSRNTNCLASQLTNLSIHASLNSWLRSAVCFWTYRSQQVQASEGEGYNDDVPLCETSSSCAANDQWQIQIPWFHTHPKGNKPFHRAVRWVYAWGSLRAPIDLISD